MSTFLVRLALFGTPVWQGEVVADSSTAALQAALLAHAEHLDARGLHVSVKRKPSKS